MMALDDVVSSVDTSPARSACVGLCLKRRECLKETLRLCLLRRNVVLPCSGYMNSQILQGGCLMHVCSFDVTFACLSLQKNIVCLRFKEATHRTTRWLDRCIAAHKRPSEQNLFAIVQGGLDPQLREISLKVPNLVVASSLQMCRVGIPRNCRGCDFPKFEVFPVRPKNGKYERVLCVKDLKERDTPGYAIGGLAGGEDKESFCRWVRDA